MMANYDREHYEASVDSALVDRFYAYVAELERLVAKHGWELEKNFNSAWCAFKPPKKRNAAFGIAFDGKDGLHLYIKRVKPEVEAFSVKMLHYHDKYDQAVFVLEPRVKPLDAFDSLLGLAYQRCLE